jgi:tetratricopeptide (TPR) repeat protein
MLMVFDDMQQMDPASKDVLSVLVRRIAGAPVLFVASCRTTDEHRPAPIFDNTGAFSWHTTVHLPSVTPAQTLVLIAALTGDDADEIQELDSVIAELSLGNPYLIEMLVSDWRHHGGHSLVATEARGDRTAALWRPPEALHRAFERQYRGIVGNARQLLNLLAIAGREMSVQELTPLLQIPLHHTDCAALDLIERGIVRAQGCHLAFKNELHRAFVYYATTEEARKYYHARLAQSLANAASSDDFQLGLEACHHFLRAAIFKPAVDIILRAGGLAVSHGAAREAERATRTVLDALSFPPPSGLHLLAAQAQVAQGKYRAALRSLEQWRPNDGNPSTDISALLLRAESLQRGGLAHPSTIAAAAREAYIAASDAGSAVELMGALQVAAEVAAESDNMEDLERLSAEALELGSSSNSKRARALGQLTRGYYCLVTAEWRESVDNFRQFLDLSRGEPPDPAQMQVLNGLGMALEALGEFDDAEATQLKAAGIAQRIGNIQGETSVWCNLAVLHDHRGNFMQSCDAYRSALRLARQSSTPRRLIWLYANIAELLVSLGNLPEARLFLDRAFEIAKETSHTPLIARALLSDACYQLARQDWEAAWHAFEEADRLHYRRRHVMDHPGLYWMIWIYGTWVRRGYGKVRQLLREPPSSLRRATLAHRAVIQLLAKSLAVRDKILEPDLSRELQVEGAHRLPGSLATVVAAGALPPDIPPPEPGESAAQLVARTFPDLVSGPVPTSVVAMSDLTDLTLDSVSPP